MFRVVVDSGMATVYEDIDYGEGIDSGHSVDVVSPGESYAGISYDDLIAGGTRVFDLEELQQKVRDRTKERVA